MRPERRLHLLEVGVRWLPETFIAWKLEGLAARGMRVTVASRNIFEPNAKLDGVELLRIRGRPKTKAGAARVAAFSGLALLVRSPRRFVKLVRGVGAARSAYARERYGGKLGLFAMCLPLARLRPDIVHFEWHSSAVDFLPLYDVWGCPVTTSARGSDISVYPHIPGQQGYARNLPDVLTRVSAVHCVSASIAREAEEFGLDPARAVVARPAVDPDRFHPGSEPREGALAAVMVGWLRWEKGYEYALTAMRNALDEGVPATLEIIGDVPPERRGGLDERERILHTIAELGLEDHVRLPGGASSAEVLDRLRASDVLLHPSLTEGIPVAVLEAMSCELPVVVTDCGGLTEAVDDGIEGFVVQPRDTRALGAALINLGRDPELRRRMGEAGRARVLSQFTIGGEHDALLAMYEKAACEGAVDR